MQELSGSVLDHILLEVGAESSQVVGVEGGAGLAPHLTANRLGLTRLVATASYNGYQVPVWYLNRG